MTKVLHEFLRQANDLTEGSYLMTTLEKDVLYMVMAQIGLKDTMQHYYHVSLADLRRETGNNNLKVSEVREAIKSLKSDRISGITLVIDDDLLLAPFFLAGIGVVLLLFAVASGLSVNDIFDVFTTLSFAIHISIYFINIILMVFTYLLASILNKYIPLAKFFGLYSTL